MFRVYLPVRKILVATFNELRAPAFRRYIAEQGIMMPKWSKTFRFFWNKLSVFALEKQPKNLNFESFFLPLGDRLVATFSETHAPTSRIYVVEQDIRMANWSKTFQTFWLHFTVFVLEKQPKNLNF